MKEKTNNLDTSVAPFYMERFVLVTRNVDLLEIVVGFLSKDN